MKIKAIVLLFYFLILITSCGYLPENAIEDNRTIIQEEKADFFMVYNGTSSPTKMMMFIPGAFVDPYAYLDWMKEICNDNFAVIVLKYPSNFALSNVSLYEKVIERYANVEEWMLAGHSLGGVVAAKIIYENTDLFKGLVLLGSYTTSFADLSSWDGSVLSIYASEDAFTTEADVEENKIFLPEGEVISTDYTFQEVGARSYYYEILGGNHSNFGNYGFQRGDNESLISKDEQWSEMTLIMNAFIQALFP